MPVDGETDERQDLLGPKSWAFGRDAVFASAAQKARDDCLRWEIWPAQKSKTQAEGAEVLAESVAVGEHVGEGHELRKSWPHRVGRRKVRADEDVPCREACPRALPRSFHRGQLSAKTGLHSELGWEAPCRVEGVHRDRGLRTAGKLRGLHRVSAQTDAFQRCPIPPRALAKLGSFVEVPARDEVGTSRGHATLCKGIEEGGRRSAEIRALKSCLLYTSPSPRDS